MTACDIAFIGHMCYDEIVPYQGKTQIAPGSAVLCGAVAAARVGKKVLVVTRLAQSDENILAGLHNAGVETDVIHSRETTYMKVIHPSADVDQRQIIALRNAGQFELSEIPPLEAASVHLAGVSDQEFSLELMRGLKSRGYSLSADMQSFVRQVDPTTREVVFRDVAYKKEIAGLMDKIKLDVVEAQVLTGTRNLEKAAAVFAGWDCQEVVITQAEGVLARVNGKTYYEKFTNRSVVGRTGRGDTAFGGYLAWRLNHDAAEALRFAAALVSIKMETPGPYQGTLQDVLERMTSSER